MSIVSTPPIVQHKSLQLVYMTFGEWLKREREKAGLTQLELSDRTDGQIKVSTISSIELETRKASERNVDRLARALGVDVQIARAIRVGLSVPDDPLLQEMIDRARKKPLLENYTDEEKEEFLEDVESTIARTTERILARRNKS